MLTALSDIQLGTTTLGTHSMLAGSLLTILGYQIFTFGLFARAGGNPIRTPTDTLTNALTGWLSLERGAALGVGILTLGSIHAGSLVVTWLANGLESLPFTITAIASFTAIVLGGQTIFNAFFLSLLTDERPC